MPDELTYNGAEDARRDRNGRNAVKGQAPGKETLNDIIRRVVEVAEPERIIRRIVE